MSLLIGNTIIDEEIRSPATGTADENDVTLATFNASAFKTALTAVTTADSLTFVTSPTGFPQYAEKTNFVSTGNTVTDYFLSGPGGAAINGVATTLKVGNTTVFLYATSNPEIVVGRVGTENGAVDIANPNGQVAFVIGLEENKTGSVVTSADMWIALYTNITQGGLNLVDNLDQLSLANLVYLNSTFDTTTSIPFENFDGVPSGNNLFNVIFPSNGSTDVQLLVTASVPDPDNPGQNELSTVNVSTTGIGAGSQHVDVDATLRIDTVQGMTKTEVDDAPEVNQASHIVYTDTGDPGTDARVELVAADFEITQLNPGSDPERADLRLSAFNVAGSDQQQTYLDNINSNGTPVDIDPEDVIVLDGSGNPAAGVTVIEDPDDPNSVIIMGLDDGTTASKTDGYQVFFTTDGVHFDRMLITNVDSDGTTFDVGNIHVTAVQGGSDTERAELGSHLKFQDDGPNIDLVSGAVVPSITDDETSFGINNHASFAGLFTAPDYGADKPGTLSYKLGVQSANVDSGLVDTLTGQHILLSYNAATNTVFGKTAVSGVEVFRITVSATGMVTLDQKRSIVHSNTSSFNETSSQMAAGLITLTAKVVDSEGATTGDSDTATANIGGSFFFKDDGPAMTGQPNGSLTPNNLQVDNNLSDAADSTDSSSYTLAAGADGKKSFTILGPADSTGTFQWTYDDSTHTSITGTVTDSLNVQHDLYTLVLNANGTYTFTMIGELPGQRIDLTSSEIKAGGPDTNTIIVGALNSDDYVVMGGSSTVGAGNINESNGFVGIDNGNVDANETLTFTLFDGDDNPIYFESIQIGTKSAQASTYHYVAHLVGGGTYEDDLSVGKDGTLDINPPGSALIMSIEITKLDGSATKIGVGDIHFVIPPEDVQLGFTLQLMDGDNDTTTKSFTVDIDGNNDGSFDATVNSAAVTLAAADPLAAPSISSAAVTQQLHSPSAPSLDAAVVKLPPALQQWLSSFDPHHDGTVWTQLHETFQADHLMEV